MQARRFQYILALVLLPVLAFLAGLNIGAARTGTIGGSNIFRMGLPGGVVDNSLLNEVVQDIRQSYYKPEAATSAVLSYGAAQGLVDALGDSHSIFLPPDDSSEFQDVIQGSLQGIGAELTLVKDRLTVTAVLRDTPAQRAGVKAGDMILKIDGEDTAKMTLAQAVKHIRGAHGTTVTLTLMHRDATSTQDVQVMRDTIQVPSVRWEMKPGDIAVITLSFFRSGTADELVRTAQEVLTKGAKGVVLDLRDNPGGVLDEAVQVVSLFIAEGDVVTQRGRESEKTYRITKQGQILVQTKDGSSETVGPSRPFLKDMPLTVVVNGSSASASEIVAGALQDYGRGLLVGEQTYGKGTVQELMPVQAGPQPGASSIKLTIAEWFTPKGRSIEKVGLTPDEVVKLSDEDITADRDPQLERALQLAAENLSR